MFNNYWKERVPIIVSCSYSWFSIQKSHPLHRTKILFSYLPSAQVLCLLCSYHIGPLGTPVLVKPVLECIDTWSWCTYYFFWQVIPYFGWFYRERIFFLSSNSCRCIVILCGLPLLLVLLAVSFCSKGSVTEYNMWYLPSLRQQRKRRHQQPSEWIWCHLLQGQPDIIINLNI